MAERITKNVCIVGGTGYVGAQFVPALLEQLSETSKVYLVTDKAEEQADARVISLPGGLKNIDQFSAELASCALVYHLPAETLLETEAELEVGLVVPTKKLVELLRGSTVLENFVLVSSTRVTGSNQTAEDKACATIEAYVRQNTIPNTIFRAGLVYGRFLPARSALTALVARIYKRENIIRANSAQLVSLIHVDDLVRALLVSVTSKKCVGKVYAAEAEALSLGAIIATIYEHIKGEKPTQIPWPSAWCGSLARTLPPAMRDQQFIDEVLGTAPLKRFEDRAIDCITTHISNVGYWIITGANSGIGYELACRLHAGGKNLILVDKDTSNLVGLGKQRIITTDLSDRQQVLGLVEKVAHYRIYALLNNAGVGYKGDYADNDLEQVERMVSVNVTAPLLLTKLLLPSIIKNNGVIVNIASSAAYNPLPGMGVYAATKAFMLHWSAALWLELRHKCLVITCAPSGTNTKFQSNAGVKQTAGLLPPRLVAHKIVTAIAKRRPFLFIGKKKQFSIFLINLLPLSLCTIVWGRLFQKTR